MQDGNINMEDGKKTENYSTKTLWLELIVDSNDKQRVKVADLIEKQLENVGINVSVYKVSNSSYKSYLKNKDYDMIITGVNNGYSPDLSYFLGEGNIANYENQEVLSILSEFKKYLQIKKR